MPNAAKKIHRAKRLLQLTILFGMAGLAAAGPGRPCASLSTLALPDTTITFAGSVAPGAFAPLEGPATPFQNLAAFCRVAATLAPTSDSEIKIEVWMPESDWNGNFQAVGNGGWSGAISFGAMSGALRRGYATASTDTGHAGGSAKFALGHPEKLIDFGYRSVHEMTVKAKAVVLAYYGRGPRVSYWNGCSSGGKQGLKEAQSYPLDYDGIIAGAPANYWTHLMAGDAWNSVVMLKDPASYIPPSQYPLLHKAALEACDALDGVKDGLISDPGNCKFDPAVLLCRGPVSEACLTGPQVEAAKKVYGGSINPRTHEIIFPGLEPGSELGWNIMAGPKPFGIPVEHFRYVVFKNPDWDFRTLNLDRDVVLADQLDHNTLNAIDPDLKKFVAHGGKLIMYHGWNDTAIAPMNSVTYFNSVVPKLGGPEKTAASLRLFMVSAMAHCSGGDGPNTFDMMSALEQWVEQGKAPERILATHSTGGTVDRTRPLCPYPQIARYTGTGSIDDAASFICSERKQ